MTTHNFYKIFRSPGSGGTSAYYIGGGGGGVVATVNGKSLIPKNQKISQLHAGEGFGAGAPGRGVNEFANPGVVLIEIT